MDKLAKLLRKLSDKERRQLEETLITLRSGDTSNLDIKKLRGHDSIYRVRVRDLRIIFLKTGDGIRLLDVSRRNEQTYRDF